MARKAAKAPGGRRKKPAAVSREQRAPTPVEVANEVVTRTRLRRVRFSDFSAHASAPPESMHDNARLQASTNFSRPTVVAGGDGEDAGFRTTSVLVFRLRMPASDRNDESEPCVVVKATLEASYTFRDDSPDFTDEQLATFVLHYCPFHVWGYWREFVHSSLARLEFPAITVPLFQIDMAQDFVVDEVTVVGRS